LSNSAFNFNTIENYILSPGDIYWIKNSGEELLVSKRGEVPNAILCKKLLKHEYVLQIRNEINLEIISKLEEYFTASKKELLVQKKNQYRSKIIELLRLEFAESDRSQLEFDIMVWKIFSKFSVEEQFNLVSIDLDLFKRSLRVTSSLVIGAFLVGYYDENFLELLFSRTMNLLMSIVKPEMVLKEVQNLEKIRVNIKSVKDIKEEVKLIFDPAVIHSEVSSWEKLLVVFNSHFSFVDSGRQVNILSDIFKNKIELNASVINMAMKTLAFERGKLRTVELT
jgi:hypothetical protein